MGCSLSATGPISCSDLINFCRKTRKEMIIMMLMVKGRKGAGEARGVGLVDD